MKQIIIILQMILFIETAYSGMTAHVGVPIVNDKYFQQHFFDREINKNGVYAVGVNRPLSRNLGVRIDISVNVLSYVYEYDGLFDPFKHQEHLFTFDLALARRGVWGTDVFLGPSVFVSNIESTATSPYYRWTEESRPYGVGFNVGAGKRFPFSEKIKFSTRVVWRYGWWVDSLKGPTPQEWYDYRSTVSVEFGVLVDLFNI